MSAHSPIRSVWSTCSIACPTAETAGENDCDPPWCPRPHCFLSSLMFFQLSCVACLVVLHLPSLSQSYTVWRPLCTVHPLRTMSGAHAHGLVQRVPHIDLNAVSVVHRLVQLLGLDLHSFRRAMCGPATLMGDRHPSRLHILNQRSSRARQALDIKSANIRHAALLLPA